MPLEDEARAGFTWRIAHCEAFLAPTPAGAGPSADITRAATVPAAERHPAPQAWIGRISAAPILFINANPGGEPGVGPRPGLQAAHTLLQFELSPAACKPASSLPDRRPE